MTRIPNTGYARCEAHGGAHITAAATTIAAPTALPRRAYHRCLPATHDPATADTYQHQHNLARRASLPTAIVDGGTG